MASHIASIRSSSSARMAKQQRAANQADDVSASDEDNNNDNISSASKEVNRNNFENSQVSQLTVLSLSDADVGGGDDLSAEMDGFRRPSNNSRTKSTSSSSKENSNNKPIASRKIFPPPLEAINNLSDIEAIVDEDSLKQMATLDKLEQRWHEIMNNIQAVLDHLQECGKQVMESSTSCLQSLMDSVDITCDEVDDELKALYHLMTKCDELTTKLSVAGSFRDEIKTLRKSVETLELLYKSKPRPQIETNRT